MYNLYKRSNTNSKLQLIDIFDNIEDIFEYTHDEQSFIKKFSTNDTDTYMIVKRIENFGGSYLLPEYKYVLYHNDVILSPATILGMFRPWNRKVRERRIAAWYNKPRRRKAYRRYRSIKTFQERKWANAWDDEDVKIRSRRNATNLPNNWDDIKGYTHKSWKKQSKRKHQWKLK
jgi:hypothetical protein